MNPYKSGGESAFPGKNEPGGFDLDLVQSEELQKFETDSFVSIDFVPAFQAFPATEESQIAYVLLKVQIGKDRRSANRTPLNIGLVLDQSSSMRGEKLYSLKTAARHLVDQLTPDDYFSLVSFNDRATTVVSCQKATSKETIKQHIDGIEAKGGTELANGLYAGINEMKPASGQTSLNFLLLLTDGQTYGDADRCVQLGQEAARQKISIHTMGVGLDWNEDLLETVAAQCGGNTEYITTADKILPVFLKKIKTLRNTITPASNLGFEPSPQVQLKQVFRVTPVISELAPNILATGTNEYNLGPLTTHTRYTLLLELVILKSQAGVMPVGNVRLAFTPAGTEKANTQIQMALGLSFTENTRGVTIDPDVKALIEKVTAFKLQAKAWQDIENGDIKSGTQRLGAVSTRLLNMGEVELANQVQQEIRNLEQRGTTSNGGRKRIKYGTRGLAADFNQG
jgi:Ca-activated chloride channel family protein